MARQLTPLGRILIVLSGLALIGYGLYQLRRVRRRSRASWPRQEGGGHRLEGRLRRVRLERPGRRRTATAPAATPASAGARLNRPIKVAIVTWGGYAGGIFANDGFAPNQESLFFKDYGDRRSSSW